MVYDQNLGFDRARTLYNELDLNGMIGGSRNNAKYVKGSDDIKFNKLDFHNEFFSRPEVRKAVLDAAIPIFENHMYRITNEDLYTQEFGINMSVADSIFTVEGEDMRKSA